MIENAIPTVTIRAGKRKKILRVDEQTLERWVKSREREGKRTTGASSSVIEQNVTA